MQPTDTDLLRPLLVLVLIILLILSYVFETPGSSCCLAYTMFQARIQNLASGELRDEPLSIFLNPRKYFIFTINAKL